MDSSENCLEQIFAEICEYTMEFRPPFVVVLEFAHFAVQPQGWEQEWAIKNLAFSEHLCSRLIHRFGRKIRIVPCIVVNDLGQDTFNFTKDVPGEIRTEISKNIFLTCEKITWINERNLRNIAFRRLIQIFNTKDNSQGISADIDRMYYDEASRILQESCPAIGNIDILSGHVVPRCTSILAALHEKALVLATQRLYSNSYVDVLLTSFTRTHHEFLHTISAAQLFIGPWPKSDGLTSSIGKFNTMSILWHPNGVCESKLALARYHHEH